MKFALALVASLMTFAAQADTAGGDSYPAPAKTGRWDTSNHLLEVVGMTCPYEINGVTKNYKCALDVSALSGGTDLTEMFPSILSDVRTNKLSVGVVYQAGNVDDSDENCLGSDYYVVTDATTSPTTKVCLKIKASNIYIK